jgi:putative SOS response-associated peptidase YedK
MCGRFSFAIPKDKVKKALPNVEMGELEQHYNIAPTQLAYVITNNDPKRLQSFKWGLIPHWAKDMSMAAGLINARKETLDEKPSFRDAIRHKRCWVLADSFYEWKTEGGKKNPYRIILIDSELMLFAGIWDEWQGIKTFSIITTEPNKEMSALHNRMPVILKNKEEQDAWLAQTDLDTVLSLCEKPVDNLLKIYRVSDKINSFKNQGAELHKEAPEDLTLF